MHSLEQLAPSHPCDFQQFVRIVRVRIEEREKYNYKVGLVDFEVRIVFVFTAMKCKHKRENII